MIGIIVTGHGLFASGIEKAVERIIGEQAQVAYVDFPIEINTDMLNQQMLEAIKAVNDGSGILFFTDLLGGTPFRTAALIAQEQTGIEVLTGTNLQMTLEIMLERDCENTTLEGFREMALACGHRGLTSLYDQQKIKSKKVVEDGI
ncbi:MAG: PTS galactosamine/N-acetylgalactosamine transporter subunit IIA [Psychromonas sp.]